MRKITLEEHYGTPELDQIREDYLTRTGFPRDLPVEFEKRTSALLKDVEAHRLPTMDAHGIALQVLSISAPAVQWLQDSSAAIPSAHRFNEALSEVVQKYPARFAAFATLPLQDPDAAAAELERTVTQLGFKGALIHGHTNGEYLDERKFDVVWERAQALDVPIYLHPNDPIPDQIKIYKGRLDLLGPDWNWGVETGTHVLRIVFGGVFDRFPNAKLIIGHMGEMIPYFLTRIDKRWTGESAGHKTPLQAPSSYFKKNVFITTTGVLAHPSLRCAIDMVGIDQVLFSVDYPYEDTRESSEFIETAPLSETDRAQICYGNAERLLKL